MQQKFRVAACDQLQERHFFGTFRVIDKGRREDFVDFILHLLEVFGVVDVGNLDED